MAAHTSSAKDICTALLYAFEKKVDPRLFIRRLGDVAGNLQAGYVQLDFFTDYKAQEREERLQRVPFWRSGKSTGQLRRGLS